MLTVRAEASVGTCEKGAMLGSLEEAEGGRMFMAGIGALLA